MGCEEAGERSPDGQWRVLVAEDNAPNQLVARLSLKRIGVIPWIVPNGEEAVKAVTSGPPFDIVFMDCSMPVLDGFAATAAIRSLDDARGRVPIVAMTAFSTDRDRARCFEVGMDEVVTKPVQRTIFAIMIERFCVAKAAPWSVG